ncbi:polynucleotide kinase 3'-phosphatase [Cryptococcus wingfieldii CBS 7118]|uniref:Polynucleotide kinase 3'-phosphatase n=1 Tax=Cryptococcus wingfieldii CBS 7118 TaxID=1295528 RepID=A0A1E3JEW6_9TREE|nr:polynucleotide kinase 3'-phosphatase [Cryptococcus wingfieldii CBS 7118]ODN99428.1 polynucleotide kinase 3'-phosphatase [Cryptococcus wingfieldii CBS 7118]
MPPQKRESDGPEPPAKKAHPFFSGGARKQTLGTFLPSEPSLIHFTHLDPFSVVQHGSSSTQSGPKKAGVMFYDLDGTLIKPKSGAKFPKDREDWQWWHPSVPERLKKEYEEGKHLVVISNQGDKSPKRRGEWREKLSLIAAKMPKDIPFRVLAALDKDVYRKPNIGMFQSASELYRREGLVIDMDNSLFIGDAAGRPSNGGKPKDHNDTDYKFALNVGLKFVTPEEHFLGHPRPRFPEPAIGFRPSSLGNLESLPYIVPSHTPITREKIEIVLFVGYPASGKSSFYRKHFEPKGYAHVNQDTLRTKDKCLLVAEQELSNGKSVVVGDAVLTPPVDNTNRDSATRAHWTALAAKMQAPIRVFHFLCPPELAKHNNLYRAYYGPSNEPTRTALPPVAFGSFASNYEKPTKQEGFVEVRTVNLHFEGTEEQRKLWDMYIE